MLHPSAGNFEVRSSWCFDRLPPFLSGRRWILEFVNLVIEDCVMLRLMTLFIMIEIQIKLLEFELLFLLVCVSVRPSMWCIFMCKGLALVSVLVFINVVSQWCMCMFQKKKTGKDTCQFFMVKQMFFGPNGRMYGVIQCEQWALTMTSFSFQRPCLQYVSPKYD